MAKNKEHEKDTVVVTDETVTAIESLSRLTDASSEQIKSLLTDWGPYIYKAYKTNGGDLRINIGLHLKGSTQKCTVKSSLAFTASKITDERESEVSLDQPDMFEQDKK